MRYVLTLAVLAALAGCALQPKIESASDLADALAREGFTAESREPIDFSEMRYAKIDEAITMRGEGLTVDILHITDPHTYDVLTSASVLLAAIGGKTDSPALTPPDIISRQPFVVVVRQEPEAGGVRAAVEDLLPAS